MCDERTSRRLLPFITAAGLLLPTVASAQSSWVPTDLGTLGGFYSYASDVNDGGQLVGDNTYAAGAPHAFLWTTSGAAMDLGTLGGSSSSARSINSAGQVVGYSSLPGDAAVHAFLWQPIGGMVDLGTLGGSSSRALGINDAGQVVGDSTTASGATHAFLWAAPGGVGGMIDLGTLGGDGSVANAINAAGQVVGHSVTAGGSVHAFLWTKGSMVDLGTLGGAESHANGINDAGQVVGDSRTAGGAFHAFLWTAGGGMVDIGTLGGVGSYAHGVNGAGQVVGDSYTTSGADHAFLWTATAGMLDLGTLGGCFSYASALNDVGQVVGQADTTTGFYHAVVWQQLLSVTALTANVSFPVTAGTPVTWTATTAGGVTPHSFQFWVFDGSAWTLGRDWSTASSWTWEPPLPGTYGIQVWLRNAGSTSAYDAWRGASATVSMPSGLTVTTVRPSVASAPAGTPVTWTATAIGGTAPYTYKFFLFDGARWSVGQDWSASASWTWTPPTPGTYAFQVWTRHAGSSTVCDAWRAFGPYTATRPPALAVTALTADPPAPRAVGTPITWTATAAGGTAPYSYKFYVFDGSAWSVGQDWSAAASWTWLPTSVGNYSIQVWVRNAGSAAPTDAWRGAAVTITAPAPLQVASLDVEPSLPVPAGTPVQWTARARGGLGPYTYQFYVFDGSTWSVGQAWSAADQWTWLPPTGGTYNVQVWVRNAGSASVYDAWTGASALSVSAATPLPAVTLTSAPMAPLIASAPVVLTAAATGGTGPYTYQFWIYYGSTWTIAQPWSGARTVTWRPPAAGTYWIQVWVRNAASVTAWDAWTGRGPILVLP